MLLCNRWTVADVQVSMPLVEQGCAVSNKKRESFGWVAHRSLADPSRSAPSIRVIAEALEAEPRPAAIDTSEQSHE